MAFIDADEFFEFRDGSKSINDFLKDYEYAGAVHTDYEIYGADKQERKTEVPVQKRFKKVFKKENGFGKIIVQPARVGNMRIHFAHFYKGSYTVNDNHKRAGDAGFFNRTGQKERLVLKHYITKSYEEWCNKIKRGTCDPSYSRKYRDFFKYNRDMEHLRDEDMIAEVQKYTGQEQFVI